MVWRTRAIPLLFSTIIIIVMIAAMNEFEWRITIKIDPG